MCVGVLQVGEICPTFSLRGSGVGWWVAFGLQGKAAIGKVGYKSVPRACLTQLLGRGCGEEWPIRVMAPSTCR